MSDVGGPAASRTSSTSHAAAPEVSVVCPVGQYMGDLEAVHREVSQVLADCGRRAEFLYVLDGPHPRAEELLGRIDERSSSVRIFRMARGFGTAAALEFGFGRARAAHIITIPDRFQADPGAIRQVLEKLDGKTDVVVTRREPRADALLNRAQSRIFHALTRLLSGHDFRDLTCELRGLTRQAALRLDLYGDLHRFLPVLAARRGFTTVEIPVAQRREDRTLRLFGPGYYARRLLDILNVFFLTRFLRKPLRFFGLVGMGLGSVGFIICALLAVSKFTGGTSLANRPLLLLGVLLLVLGVQVISIGLIAELVIFLGSRNEPPEVTEIEADNH